MLKRKVLACVLFSVAFHCFANNPPASAVVSSHPLATEAGMEILAKGGNAFDAAVAVASVLAVVEGYQSGLGGGGFWLLHDNRNPQKQRNIVIDAREKAPLKASKDMYLVKDNPSHKRVTEGALAAAIPGEAAGITYLALNYGKLPLQQSLARAITTAEEGFQLDEVFINALKEHQSLLSQFPSSSQVFLVNGSLPVKGALLKQPDLARTLKALRSGPAGFYYGLTAKALVDAVEKDKGIWQLEDLRQYKVIERQVILGTYHDIDIITTPLPSAGGIGLISALNILDEYGMDALSEADKIHLAIESLRRTFCDRSLYLGDPDYIKIDITQLLDKKHAQDWRESIDINHATKSSQLNCGVPFNEGEHTTHYSILDQDGNAVSATLSLNRPFGSGFVAQGTGVLLNNEMDDFSLQVGVPNSYGLLGHEANEIAPGKRPLSSMMPTIFSTEHGFGIIGAAGGSRIPSIILNAILVAEHNKDPNAWVKAARFHQQVSPDKVLFEKESFPVPLQNALKLRGHELEASDLPIGRMQAIYWDRDNNQVYAATDPRGKGLALVKDVRGQVVLPVKEKHKQKQTTAPK